MVFFLHIARRACGEKSTRSCLVRRARLDEVEIAPCPTGNANGKGGDPNTIDGLFGRSFESMELLIVLLPVLALAGSGLVLQSVRRGGFIALGAMTLVAGSCFGYYFQHFQLGPLPLSSERLLVFVMAIAYLICRWKQVGVDPIEIGRAHV